MKTHIRRYRRSCLDAYSLRRERSLGFDNNAPPNYWANQLLTTIFSEPWGEYASGEPSVVAAANWTFSAATTSSIVHGVNSIQYPGGQVAFTAHTAALVFNANKAWEIDFTFNVAGGVTSNSVAWYGEDDGTSGVGFGVIIQADGIDGNINATMQAGGLNVGLPNIVLTAPVYTGTHSYRFTVDTPANNKQMSLYFDNVLAFQRTPPSHVSTGSKELTLKYAPSAAGNSGFIGPVTFKGHKT